MSAPAVEKLPAKPLADVVDRMIASCRDTKYVLELLEVQSTTISEWRHKPGRKVSAEMADSVLLRSPYLWYDVWLPCPEHVDAARDCSACVGYFRARLYFDGDPLPATLASAAKAAKSTGGGACAAARCSGTAVGRARYCPACKDLIAGARRSVAEGMWAAEWSTQEISDLLGVSASYLSARRHDGWDLPYRYRRGDACGRTWRDKALTMRAASPDTSAAEIARRVGITPSAVRSFLAAAA